MYLPSIDLTKPKNAAIAQEGGRLQQTSVLASALFIAEERVSE